MASDFFVFKPSNNQDSSNKEVSKFDDVFFNEKDFSTPIPKKENFADIPEKPVSYYVVESKKPTNYSSYNVFNSRTLDTQSFNSREGNKFYNDIYKRANFGDEKELQSLPSTVRDKKIQSRVNMLSDICHIFEKVPQFDPSQAPAIIKFLEKHIESKGIDPNDVDTIHKLMVNRLHLIRKIAVDYREKTGNRVSSFEQAYSLALPFIENGFDPNISYFATESDINKYNYNRKKKWLDANVNSKNIPESSKNSIAKYFFNNNSNSISEQKKIIDSIKNSKAVNRENFMQSLDFYNNGKHSKTVRDFWSKENEEFRGGILEVGEWNRNKHKEYDNHPLFQQNNAFKDDLERLEEDFRNSHPTLYKNNNKPLTLASTSPTTFSGIQYRDEDFLVDRNKHLSYTKNSDEMYKYYLANSEKYPEITKQLEKINNHSFQFKTDFDAKANLSKNEKQLIDSYVDNLTLDKARLHKDFRNVVLNSASGRTMNDWNEGNISHIPDDRKVEFLREHYYNNTEELGIFSKNTILNKYDGSKSEDIARNFLANEKHINDYEGFDTDEFLRQWYTNPVQQAAGLTSLFYTMGLTDKEKQEYLQYGTVNGKRNWWTDWNNPRYIANIAKYGTIDKKLIEKHEYDYMSPAYRDFMEKERYFDPNISDDALWEKWKRIQDDNFRLDAEGNSISNPMSWEKSVYMDSEKYIESLLQVNDLLAQIGGTVVTSAVFGGVTGLLTRGGSAVVSKIAIKSATKSLGRRAGENAYKVAYNSRLYKTSKFVLNTLDYVIPTAASAIPGTVQEAAGNTMEMYEAYASNLQKYENDVLKSFHEQNPEFKFERDSEGRVTALRLKPNDPFEYDKFPRGINAEVDQQLAEIEKNINAYQQSTWDMFEHLDKSHKTRFFLKNTVLNAATRSYLLNFGGFNKAAAKISNFKSDLLKGIPEPIRNTTGFVFDTTMQGFDEVDDNKSNEMYLYAYNNYAERSKSKFLNEITNKVYAGEIQDLTAPELTLGDRLGMYNQYRKNMSEWSEEDKMSFLYGMIGEFCINPTLIVSNVMSGATTGKHYGLDESIRQIFGEESRYPLSTRREIALQSLGIGKKDSSGKRRGDFSKSDVFINWMSLLGISPASDVKSERTADFNRRYTEKYLREKGLDPADFGYGISSNSSSKSGDDAAIVRGRTAVNESKSREMMIGVSDAISGTESEPSSAHYVANSEVRGVVDNFARAHSDEVSNSKNHEQTREKILSDIDKQIEQVRNANENSEDVTKLFSIKNNEALNMLESSKMRPSIKALVKSAIGSNKDNLLMVLQAYRDVISGMSDKAFNSFHGDESAFIQYVGEKFNEMYGRKVVSAVAKPLLQSFGIPDSLLNDDTIFDALVPVLFGNKSGKNLVDSLGSQIEVLKKRAESLRNEKVGKGKNAKEVAAVRKHILGQIESQIKSLEEFRDSINNTQLSPALEQFHKVVDLLLGGKRLTDKKVKEASKILQQLSYLPIRSNSLFSPHLATSTNVRSLAQLLKMLRHATTGSIISKANADALVNTTAIARSYLNSQSMLTDDAFLNQLQELYDHQMYNFMFKALKARDNKELARVMSSNPYAAKRALFRLSASGDITRKEEDHCIAILSLIELHDRFEGNEEVRKVVDLAIDQKGLIKGIKYLNTLLESSALKKDSVVVGKMSEFDEVRIALKKFFKDNEDSLTPSKVIPIDTKTKESKTEDKKEDSKVEDKKEDKTSDESQKSSETPKEKVVEENNPKQEETKQEEPKKDDSQKDETSSSDNPVQKEDKKSKTETNPNEPQRFGVTKSERLESGGYHYIVVEECSVDVDNSHVSLSDGQEVLLVVDSADGTVYYAVPVTSSSIATPNIIKDEKEGYSFIGVYSKGEYPPSPTAKQRYGVVGHGKLKVSTNEKYSDIQEVLDFVNEHNEKPFQIKIEEEKIAGTSTIKVVLHQFGDDKPIKTFILPSPKKGVKDSIDACLDVETVKNILFHRISTILLSPNSNFTIPQIVERLNKIFESICPDLKIVFDAQHPDGEYFYFEYHDKNILTVNLNDENAFESIINKISSLPQLNKQALLYKMLPSTASDFLASLADEITDSTPIQSVTFVKSEETINSEKEFFKSQTEPKQEPKKEAKEEVKKEDSKEEEKPKSEEPKPEEPKDTSKEDTPATTEEPKVDTSVAEESTSVEEQKTSQEDVPTQNIEDAQPVNVEEQNASVVEEIPINNPEEQQSDFEEDFSASEDDFFSKPSLLENNPENSSNPENSAESTPSPESVPEVEGAQSFKRDITYYFPDGEGLALNGKAVDPDVLLEKYPSCYEYMKKSHPELALFNANDVVTYLENEGKCF